MQVDLSAAIFSLPIAVAQRVRRVVKRGLAPSVSAYVTRALEEQTKLDELSELLAERNNPRSLELGQSLAIPGGVVGQVWRDGRRQARLSRFLAADEVDVEILDDQRARAAGQLCGVKGTADVIDASVVLCAQAREQRIVTSDAADLRTLDPKAQLIVV